MLQLSPAALPAGTPADKILQLLANLAEGSHPSGTDIEYIQAAILECQNIYKPLNMKQQIMQSDKLEVRTSRPALHSGSDSTSHSDSSLHWLPHMQPFDCLSS